MTKQERDSAITAVEIDIMFAIEDDDYGQVNYLQEELHTIYKTYVKELNNA